MSAEKNTTYGIWLETFRERQTDRNISIEEMEQSLSNDLEELAGMFPVLEVFASAFRMHVMLRKLWKQFGSSVSKIDTLVFGEGVDSPMRTANRDQQICMDTVEQSLSDGLVKLAPLCAESTCVIYNLARSVRVLSMMRKEWQDTEDEIDTVLEDPCTPEHHEKMQRMLSRVNTLL
jgi:hypothetical protein